jgi:hypothetical protein
LPDAAAVAASNREERTMDLRKRLGALLLVALLSLGAVACTAEEGGGQGADDGATEEPTDEATDS